MSQGVNVVGLYVRDQDERSSFTSRSSVSASTPTRETAITAGSRCSTRTSHPSSSACSRRGRQCSTRQPLRPYARSSRRARCRRWCSSSTTAALPTTGCARGVEFTQEPVDRYGTVDAGFVIRRETGGR